MLTTTGTGIGGSSGTGAVDAGDSGPTATCPAAVTCALAGADCGPISDGCGGILQCGVTCPTGQLCGGAGVVNQCGTPSCTPVTCGALGVTCGMEGDGCGGTVDCGNCTLPDTCGGGGTSGACGHAATDAGICTPQTCAGAGADCGPLSDGCGNLLQCGATCPTNTTCGGGGMANVCGAPPCVPASCATLNAGCGTQGDGCGGTIDCGTCAVAGQTCGGGGTPSQCGAPACTGLCTQQVVCTAPATTSVSGTVYAPNGVDPLPDVVVYVPNSTPEAFTDGVDATSCACAPASAAGNPLVTATTAFDGTFTLTNMPVGTSIPLVIQNGKWRRQFVIPSVPACVDTALPTTGAGQIRFPRTHLEGDIPRMGFVTGQVDALECVLRKIGIADSEFSDPSGTGRVRFYQGGDTPPAALNGAPGARYSATTPHEDQLWGTQAAINQYDMVYFACQGKQYNKTAAAQQAVLDYANLGGRVFTTHYSYVWLYNEPPFSTTATWQVNQTTHFVSDPETGTINQTGFAKGTILAEWLQLIGATTTQGQIPINTLRHDFDAVAAPPVAQEWIYLPDPSYTPAHVPMHYTFDTPVIPTPVPTPLPHQCGRVLYDDFHVENASAMTTNTTFPNECTVAAMSPQEKMLEFMIFDLGASLCPVQLCTPMTCPAGVACGTLGDGCGGTIDCGACPSGAVCQAGACGSPACTPEPCPAGITCGTVGDGCGGTVDCGACPSGETCGGGGVNGQCGEMGCVPKPCPTALQCGPGGDGCGNVIECGVCPAGETCGGGGVAGTCGAPKCTPKTCADFGFDCGEANDGCGTILKCGTCTLPQTCGGAGMADVCGVASQAG